MTSSSGISEPITAEDEAVEECRDLDARLQRVGAPNLRFAHLNWSLLFTSGHPPGALTPSVAKSALTRKARTKSQQRRLAARRGPQGLLRALSRLP